jgi:hypothetical protein
MSLIGKAYNKLDRQKPNKHNTLIAFVEAKQKHLSKASIHKWHKQNQPKGTQ